MNPQQPYTIRLFLPDGNPDTLKIIDKMNWTGVGLEVARSAWATHRKRKEFEQAGVYILIGYQNDDDIATLYIGQGDGVKTRIDSHEKQKDFWDKALVFISSNNGLNRAHITWLEWALIEKAKEARRCYLDNNQNPVEPALTESEKADTQAFLGEILSILPLVEVKSFNKATKIRIDAAEKPEEPIKHPKRDTVIVPAQAEGFQKVFLEKHCWHAIRIGGGNLKNIKYIAAYQTAPISAITHIAEVESIEPYGDGGKYQLNFKEPATAINPIPLGNAKTGTMQGSRYTHYEKLKNVETVADLFR